MTTFRVGSASDVGQVRSNNQDSKLVADGVGVYAVADTAPSAWTAPLASAVTVSGGPEASSLARVAPSSLMCSPIYSTAR